MDTLHAGKPCQLLLWGPQNMSDACLPFEEGLHAALCMHDTDSCWSVSVIPAVFSPICRHAAIFVALVGHLRLKAVKQGVLVD